MTTPRLSVVVVSWNTRDVLADCLASVRRQLAGVAHETIVVDNASSDGSAEMVATAFPEVHLLRNAENVGFGRACNAGMDAARGPWVLLLNSDARLVDASIVRLLDQLEARPEVALAGPRIVGLDGRLQPSAHRFGTLRRLVLEELGLYKLLSRRRTAALFLGGYWAHGEERFVDWVTGACMVVRREAFVRTGGFDARIFLYGEDEEWCRRIRRAGFEVLFSPSAEVVHAGHVSAHRAIGAAGRVGRCLAAGDALLRREHGTLAAAAPAIRVTGALLRLLAFRVRPSTPDGDARALARWHAHTVLRHYGRRVRRAWSREDA